MAAPTANGTTGHTNSLHGTTKYPKSGIKVIIVGAGFGGLSTAIECHRQGHHPVIYESFPSLKVLGDIITFGSNAGRIFARWSDGAVTRRMRPIVHDTQGRGFNIHKFDTGEIMYNQKSVGWSDEAPFMSGHRGELHEIVYDYAVRELGIEVHLGKRIEEYWENEGEAGIVLADGERVPADIVIAADGVRSKARTIVLGHVDPPKPSGYAIWRAWFSSDAMLADPKTAHFCSGGDTFNGWIGADIHFLFSTIKGGKDCCWVLTHKDDADIEESWSFPGKISDVKNCLKDWDPMCTRIIEKTPEDKLVDWKLVYRDPLPTWVSPKARILLLGDSAHPFLPTSAQGAAQAVEDGATIATCLRHGGKDDVQTAVRAHEKIRYERVKAVQKTGETTRDMWHKVDWDAVRKDPQSIQFPRADWIMEHDPEKHADEVYGEIAKSVTI